MQVDVIRELIDRILAATQREGTFTESMALEIERSFRREFNGAECYVKERTETSIAARREAVVSAYLADKPVEEITKHHGISRATLYRYLKK